MPINFVLIEKANPSNPEAPKKFYIQTKSNGYITLEAIGKEIAYRNVINYTTILGILNDLMQFLAEQLADGKIIRLGNFGTFQVHLSSEGMSSPDEFDPSMIRSKKIVFRPGADLKKMISNLEIEKLLS